MNLSLSFLANSLYLSFSSSGRALHSAASFLLSSLKVISGFSPRTLSRLSLRKCTYPLRGCFGAPAP